MNNELNEQTFLDSLTESQKQQLFLLLKENPIEKKPSPVTKSPPKQKRRQKRASKEKHNEEHNEEPEDNTRRRPTKRKASRSKKHKFGGKAKGNPAKREHFQVTKRQNDFLTGGDFNKHKKDVKIDKKLTGDNELTKCERDISYVTAVCAKCDYEFDNVPTYQCYKDDEGLRFTCDECSDRR